MGNVLTRVHDKRVHFLSDSQAEETLSEGSRCPGLSLNNSTHSLLSSEKTQHMRTWGALCPLLILPEGPEVTSAPPSRPVGSALRETPATLPREPAVISAASAEHQSPHKAQSFPGGCLSLVYKWAVTLHQFCVRLRAAFTTPFWNSLSLSLSLSATPSFLSSTVVPGLEPLKSSCATTAPSVLGQN